MSIKISSDFKKIYQMLLPLLIIILIPVLAIKFLLPKVSQIFQHQRQLKIDETEVIKLETKADFLEKQKENNVKADFEKVLIVLPNEKDVAGLLIALENLRKTAAMKIGNFGLRPGLVATDSGELKSQTEEELQFSLPITSSYQNLVQFLETIEKTAPLTSVERIGIDFQAGKEEVKANLFLKTHYFPLNQEPLIIENPLPEFSPEEKESLDKVLSFQVFSYQSSLLEDKIGKENPFQPLVTPLLQE